MPIEARVIAHSVSAAGGPPLITMQVTMHRYVLAEFNTHRVMSRSFRSSRAVPVAKLIEEVRTAPAEPVVWLKNKPGMQATEPMTAEERDNARELWLDGARDAALLAEDLAEAGLHKQWANRCLEPYLYVHGVVTATEWANFFALRRHKDAQPEMKVLADLMWEAQQASTPTVREPGQWHLPYTTYADVNLLPSPPAGNKDHGAWFTNCMIKLSVARCARVSYLTHDGRKPAIEDDLKLYERLVGSVPIHASPAEHQATPDDDRVWPHEHGNFSGWRQYRKMLPGESG